MGGTGQQQTWRNGAPLLQGRSPEVCGRHALEAGCVCLSWRCGVPGVGSGWRRRMAGGPVTVPVGEGKRRGSGERLGLTARGPPAGACPASPLGLVEWATVCTHAIAATDSVTGTWPLAHPGARTAWRRSERRSGREKQHLLTISQMQGTSSASCLIKVTTAAKHCLGRSSARRYFK